MEQSIKGDFFLRFIVKNIWGETIMSKVGYKYIFKDKQERTAFYCWKWFIHCLIFKNNGSCQHELF